jgi:hypothetical protein
MPAGEIGRPRRGDDAIAATLRQDLLKQDCASPASFTWPVTRPVDPFHHIRPPARAAGPAGGHAGLTRMLEWAYGYRPGGAGRRTPSAGGLYPCEVLTVEHGPDGWVCQLYDFGRQARIALPRADAGALARLLRLDETRAGVLVLAALWRTVQRYGARGYRYCALDAGHVLGNLSRVASVVGGRVRWHAPPGPELSSMTGLSGGAVVLAAGVIDIAAAHVPSPPGAGARDPADGGPPEETPLLSPQLLRVRRFHDRAQACGASSLRTPSAATTGDLFLALDSRRSAKDFLAAEPEDISVKALGAVQDFLSEPSMRAAGTIIPVAREVAGQRAAGALSPAGLCRVCQRQELVSRADAAFLFTAPRPERANDILDHAGFLRACLYSGMVSSELYRLADGLGLASTMIGGFFDSELLGACGPGRYPLALQLFGRPVSGPARKADAAIMAASGA